MKRISINNGAKAPVVISEAYQKEIETSIYHIEEKAKEKRRKKKRMAAHPHKAMAAAAGENNEKAWHARRKSAWRNMAPPRSWLCAAINIACSVVVTFLPTTNDVMPQHDNVVTSAILADVAVSVLSVMTHHQYLAHMPSPCKIA